MNAHDNTIYDNDKQVMSTNNNNNINDMKRQQNNIWSQQHIIPNNLNVLPNSTFNYSTTWINNGFENSASNSYLRNSIHAVPTINDNKVDTNNLATCSSDNQFQPAIPPIGKNLNVSNSTSPFNQQPLVRVNKSNNNSSPVNTFVFHEYQSKKGEIKVTKNIKAKKEEHVDQPVVFPKLGTLYVFNVESWKDKKKFYESVGYSFGQPSTQCEVFCSYFGCRVMHHERTCQGIFYCPLSNGSCISRPGRLKHYGCTEHEHVSLVRSGKCGVKLHFYIPIDPNDNRRLLLCLGRHSHPRLSGDENEETNNDYISNETFFANNNNKALNTTNMKKETVEKEEIINPSVLSKASSPFERPERTNLSYPSFINGSPLQRQGYPQTNVYNIADNQSSVVTKNIYTTNQETRISPTTVSSYSSHSSQRLPSIREMLSGHNNYPISNTYDQTVFLPSPITMPEVNTISPGVNNFVVSNMNNNYSGCNNSSPISPKHKIIETGSYNNIGNINNNELNNNQSKRKREVFNGKYTEVFINYNPNEKKKKK